MEWDKEKTLYFIDIYREEAVLWNPGHPEHFNKLKREVAWVRLASLLDTQTEVCKKKMTSLLASLRREKLKNKQSIGTGKGVEEVYHSTWFAYKAMIFLLDRNKPGATRDTLRKGGSEQSDIDSPPPAEKSDIDCPPPAEKSDIDCLPPAAKSDIVNPPPAKKSNIDCPPPAQKRKKIVATNPEDIMLSTLNILKKKAEQAESTSQKLDECDAYGVFISNKLRSYSMTARFHVQHYFSNILFSANRGEYDYVGNYNYRSPQEYSTQPTTSRAPLMPQQFSPEATASHMSEQTDCQSTKEQLLSEFGDLI